MVTREELERRHQNSLRTDKLMTRARALCDVVDAIYRHPDFASISPAAHRLVVLASRAADLVRDVLVFMEFPEEA